MGGDSRDSVIRAAMAEMVNAVTALQQHGQPAVSQAFKNLAERVIGSEIAAQTRQDIVENLVYVAQQAQAPPERRKRGVVKAALAFVRHSMQSSAPLNDAWHTFGHTIENFFHL